MSLEEILNKIREQAVRKDELRQEIQTIARKTTRMSKQAIFLTHKNRIGEAEEVLKEASLNIVRLNEVLKAHPDLLSMGLIDPALEEYAEAQIFLKIIRDEKIPSPEDINIPSEQYVLGLADVIGELRRRSLDLIRKGAVEEAEKCLNVMETIYNGIIGCDELLIFISGLRRKCDVARRVIEATRGDVTAEVRRSALSNMMRDLQRILESKINREE
ncbi:MAG: hypothetical protein QXX94_03600 [Candidatus Bathyarchaeia archaeon]